MTAANALPANFRRIKLELAREPGHPEGERHIGYVLMAPLLKDGALDADAAQEHRALCTVARIKDGALDAKGVLRRRPGGSWAFHYEADGAEDDDPGYRLGEHRFMPGEYVTIHEDEGAHTYRVVSVQTP